MVRLMIILAALGCAAMAGCEGHGKGSVSKTESSAALYGENWGIKEGAPCLVNFNSGLTACGSSIIGQRRHVLIRNVILPAEE